MKYFILFTLIMVSFVFAQTVQEQHNQYLIATKNATFLKAQSTLLQMDSYGEQAPDISLKIDGNKYSLLIVCSGKKVYQEGIVTLEKQPSVLTITKFADKEMKIGMHFLVEPGTFGVKLEGNYAEIFPPRIIEAVLVQVGAFAYPVMKKNVNTDHYAEVIKAFVMSERPLFHLIFHSPQPTITSEQTRFGCPNCDYDFYYYAHYCNNCGNCFSGGSLTCNKCYSQNWTNGKSCSRCGYCYR